MAMKSSSAAKREENPKSQRPSLGRSAERLLSMIAASGQPAGEPSAHNARDISALLSADLIARGPGGVVKLTRAGLAHLARAEIAQNDSRLDPFLGQHLALTRLDVDTATGLAQVAVDDCESPLAWLAR